MCTSTHVEVKVFGILHLVYMQLCSKCYLLVYIAVRQWSTYGTYSHILVPMYLSTYLAYLAYKIIYFYLPCQIVVRHNLSPTSIILAIFIYFTTANSNATATLQTRWDIGDQHHRASRSDLKTNITIYLGLPTRLLASKNNNFVPPSRTFNKYVDSTIHSAS